MGLCEGNLEGVGASFTGDPERFYSKTLEKDIFLHRVLNGEYGGTLLYRDFGINMIFCFIKRPCLLGNPREM